MGAAKLFATEQRVAAMSTFYPVNVRIDDTPYATRIAAGTHALTADEPENLGGGDTGPNPYDLLLASLGACTAITLRMYADRKGWPLKSVEIGLEKDRVHAKDCDDCESTEGHVLKIRRQIELGGDLDADQRKRLLEIADRCPVHQSLTGEVKITSELATTQ